MIFFILSVQVLEYVDMSGNNFVEMPSHTFTVLKALRTINISNCNIRRVKSGMYEDNYHNVACVSR